MSARRRVAIILLGLLAAAGLLAASACAEATPTPPPGLPAATPVPASPTPITPTPTPVLPTGLPKLASLPENPCDVLTVEQVSAATGLQVTAQRRVPSIDEIVQAQGENRAPPAGRMCIYETSSEFGLIELGVPLATERTSAAYSEARSAYFGDFPGSAKTVPGLGEDAWISGGTSLRVLVREGVWFSLSTQYGQQGSRDLLVRLASAALSRFQPNPQLWNDGSGRGHAGRRDTDDVGFVRAFLDDLARRLNVDASRVHVTGHSNGASIAYRLAAELAERIAAAAPVSGHLWLTEARLSRPVPLLLINGTADPLNPLEGGDVRLPWGNVEHHPPILSSVIRRAELDGCSPRPRVIHDQGGVKGVSYAPCRRDAEVLFYTIEGQGHAWPGGTSLLAERLIGKSTDKLNATDLIWEFFSKQRLN